MSRIRSSLAAALTAALGVYACSGDGIVLPDDSVPAEIVVLGGDGQTAPAGSTLGQALEVRVSDTDGRPVANQDVTFTIEVGGGEVVPASARTDADGHASTTWTLGPGAGLQRLRAQAGDEDVAVSFTATALAGSGSTLALVSGDGQTAPVNSALPSPLVVRVLDPLGNPVSGQTITWSVSGGGSIEPATSTSDQNGQASAERVLGSTAGPQSAQAAGEGLAGSPVTFTHTAQASAPASLVRVSGDGQTAPAGFQLPESLVVQLRDANGNGVPGRTVTWVVSQGSGVVNPMNSQTDEDGYAVTRWTLGPTDGTHTLNAVFSGLASVPFTATATADVPTTIEMVGGDGQTGPAGSPLPDPLRVKVTDANGNEVENVTVTWTAEGGGSVSSTTTGTNAQGIAEVSRTLGPIPGQYTTTAAVDGLAGSPVTFTSTATVGQPAKLAFLTQPSSALVGQNLGTIQVEVQDAQGNRVPGATNQVTITSSVAGTLTGDNTENAANGVATFASLALREARAGYRLTAHASGLAEAISDPFDIAKGATTIDITGRTPTSSVTGQSVTINFDVDVTAPAAGNLTGSVTVSDGTQSCTGGTTNAGSGSCSIAFSTAGARTLTATYFGDPNFEGSTSAGVQHTVGKADVTVAITSDLPDPSGIGEEVTVEYTVTGGGVAPTGSVTIKASATETCSASVAAGTCKMILLTSGSRTLTADYSGDGNYNADPNADTEPHSVRTATTTTVTTSNGSAVFGESVTFTATVAPVAPVSEAPAGTVQFRANGLDLGGPVSLSQGDNSSTATHSTNSLAIGSYVITAVYTPNDDTFAASTGTLSPDQQVDRASTTTTITDIAPEPSNPGEPYTVTVSVAAAPPGSGTPGGTVAVSDGEVGSCQITLGGGSGSCSLSTATSGAKTITATYGGDASFLPGSSDTEAHQVNNPPVATPDSYSGPAGLPISRGAEEGVLVNDSDLDGDDLSAVLVDDVQNGILLLTAENGAFIYTPDALFVGTDSFTYFATDGSANSAIVTVTLQVGP